MSDVLPPLGDMTLDEAARRRGELLRALSSGALSVRNTDGSAVTYRNMAEMKTALTEIERWITAATAAASGRDQSSACAGSRSSIHPIQRFSLMAMRPAPPVPPAMPPPTGMAGLELPRSDGGSSITATAWIFGTVVVVWGLMAIAYRLGYLAAQLAGL